MKTKEKYYKIIELQILNSDNEILIEINNLENQINKII